MTDLLTIAETGKLLHVSPRTVQRLIAAREIKVVKVRGATRITPDEVTRYAKARERLA